MGLFHQNLNIAEQLVNKSDYQSALKNLEMHLNMHVIRSEFNSLGLLKNRIIDYEKDLMAAVTILRTPSPNLGMRQNEINQHIESARREIVAIEAIMLRLQPLVKSEE